MTIMAPRTALLLIIVGRFFSTVALAQRLNPGSAITQVHMVTGNQNDFGSAVAVDKSGFSYLAGATSSTDIQATAGSTNMCTAPLSALEPCVFVQKLSADGSRILYTALLGQSNSTAGIGLKVDSSGNVYVAFNAFGTPRPAGFSTPNAAVSVMKLSANGDRVLFSARVLNVDYLAAVALDLDETGVYVAASSRSLAVSKLDLNGTREIYNYVMPEVSTKIAGIAVASDQSLYIAGTIMGGTLQTTPGSLKQTTQNPQNSHGFVFRLSADGRTRVFSTYISGDYSDTVNALSLGTDGSAYLAGSTQLDSTTSGLRVTPLGFAPAADTAYGFVLKVSADGTKTLYGTLLPFLVSASAVDATGKVYAAETEILGATVVALDPTGSKFVFYSTMPHRFPFNGSGAPPIGITLDASGLLWLAGTTNSVNVPDLTVIPKGLPNHAYFVQFNPSSMPSDVALSITSTQQNGPDAPLRFDLTIQNNGPAAAADVVVAVPQIKFASFIGCKTSSGGLCPTDLRIPQVTFASIAPGDKAVVEVSVAASLARGAVLRFAATVSTSSSDANRSDNTAQTQIAFDDFVSVNLTANIPNVVYRLDGSTQGTFTTGFPAGVPANSLLQVFWPSPQDVLGVGPVSFLGWFDGNKDNPRTISVGSADLSLDAEFGVLRTPYISADAVSNAASFSSGAISPGEEVTLFGFNLANSSASGSFDTNGILTQQLNGTSLSFNGVLAPLLYVGSSQVSAIVPYSVSGKSTVDVILKRGGASTPTITLPVATSAPGLFTVNSSGRGPLAAFNQDGTLNSASNPASLNDVVTVFGTGEGITDPLLADGALVNSPLPMPHLPVTVTVGGVPAAVLYAGGSPGSAAGLLQVNFRLPANAPPGPYVPVQVKSGSNTSQDSVSIAIAPVGSPATPLTPLPSVKISRPTISLLTPFAAAGSFDTNVLVQGNGFSADMSVCWNGDPRTTRLLGSTKLQGTLTAQDLASPSMGYISLCNSSGQLSDDAPFFVYVALKNRDFLYDPQRQRLYVAVSHDQGSPGQSIAVVNPANGNVDRVYPLDNEPLALAISDDRRYLYVGLDHYVRRIDLNNWTADPDIDLGNRQASSIVVLPGKNRSFIVSGKEGPFSANNAGTSAFDDSMQRAATAPSYEALGQLVQGPDEFTAYGAGFVTFKLDASGVSIARTISGLITGYPVYAGGLLYDSTGLIIDPSRGSLTGELGIGNGMVCPLPDIQRVLTLGKNGFLGSVDIQTYDLALFDSTALSRIWTVQLPPLSLADPPGRLVRWGTDGIAFRAAPAFGVTPYLIVLRLPIR